MNKNAFIRRYELDWLRVMAVFFVFVYHCSLIFATDPYSIKNAVLYPYLNDLGSFAEAWGMPLILVVSGASAFHALGKVGAGRYVKGLLARLLLPLAIGIFTHAAVQIYFENLHTGKFSGSFFEFYPHYFEGLYGFGGNFAWMGMHLWYLEALFIFSLLCLPVFLWLRNAAMGRSFLRRLGDLLAKPAAIYLLSLTTTLMFNLFDPDGLGMTVLGGWSIFSYLTFFIGGYVIYSSQRLQFTIERMRWVSLAAAIVTRPLIDILWEALGDPTFGTWQFLSGTALYCLSAWCWLLVIFGFAMRHLNRQTPLIRYANEANLPFYIMHQSVLIPLAYFIVQWSIPDLSKFLLVLGLTFIVVMLTYELVVRRFNLLRILFGMKALAAKASQPKEARLIEPVHSV
jgi:glucans biosynthesis protein C